MRQKRVSEKMSAIRAAQRQHAKKRFQQRYSVSMNRDRIYEIEKMIANNKAILIERRPPIRNYFVAVDGKLVAIGYNAQTKRVVTALPDAYIEQLPAEFVQKARLRLLGDKTSGTS